MAIDFPPSPTVGTTYQGFTWNGYAWAYSSPGGYIKADGSIPMTGKLQLATTTVDLISLNFGGGSAFPGSPVNGDMWMNANGLFGRIGSTTYQFVATAGAAFTGAVSAASFSSTGAFNSTNAGVGIQAKNASFGGVDLISTDADGGWLRFTNSAGSDVGGLHGTDVNFITLFSTNSGRGILVNNAGNGPNYWLTGNNGFLTLRGHATLAQLKFENASAGAGGYIKYDWSSSPVVGLLLSNLSGMIWQLREDGWCITNGNITAPRVDATNFFGTYNPPSDERIKDVHGPFTMGLNELLELELVEYSYKPETGHGSKVRPGLIAQQAEPTSLGAMLVNTNEQIFEGVVYPDIKSIEPDVLIMALINAVRTLDARVKQLEAAP